MQVFFTVQKVIKYDQHKTTQTDHDHKSPSHTLHQIDDMDLYWASWQVS